MSTTYMPFLGIGKLFRKLDEATSFILESGVIEYLDPAEDLEELSDRCGLLVHYLDGDDCYFVGIKVDSNTPMELATDVYDAEHKFKSMVGIQGDLIHTVDSY